MWVRCVSLNLLWLVGGCAIQQQGLVRHDWGPDTLMVVLEDPRSARSLARNVGPGYSARLGYADDPVLNRRVQSLARDYELTVLTQWPVESLRVHCFLIHKPQPARLADLRSDPRVKWVQPFNEFTTSASNRLGIKPNR